MDWRLAVLLDGAACSTHLVVLGGEAVQDVYADQHQGHVLDGNPNNAPVLGMSAYHIASGIWYDCGPTSDLLGVVVPSRFVGVPDKVGVLPISNHQAFALPPTLVVRRAAFQNIAACCLLGWLGWRQHYFDVIMLVGASDLPAATSMHPSLSDTITLSVTNMLFSCSRPVPPGLSVG
eukprot:SAG22_NODE_25_length_30107_cov_28.456412_11_plen_177_part_00